MGLNSFQLKCIAITTMLIDHTGKVLFPGNMIFVYVGRIAFPIFCFLLVEGFFHTRDVYKYIVRLGVFALISEVPFDLAFRQTLLEIKHQNVFFTLLLGMLLMCALEKTSELQIKAVEILLTMWAAEFLHVDYSYRGILLIIAYYFFRENEWLKLSVGVMWNFLRNRSSQMYGALAVVPIAMYNGERGPSVKYFFYVFYPTHLLVLYILKIYI